jgi:hypothetical protein
MKHKISKILGVSLALVMALSLTIALAPVSVGADPGVLKWTKTETPSLSTSDGRVIYKASDWWDMAVGPDGDTVWVIGQQSVNDSNCLDLTEPRAMKSTNGGKTWSDKTKKYTTGVTGALDTPSGVTWQYFTAVAVAPDDADLVAVAGETSNGAAVVVSTDGGTYWYWTGEASGDPITDGSDWVEFITDMAISPEVNGKRSIIIVGVDDGGDGTVWRLEIGAIVSTWKDATDGATYPGWMSTWTVTSVAISPAWATDYTVVIIGASNGEYYLQYGKFKTTKGWNGSAGFPSAIRIEENNNPFDHEPETFCPCPDLVDQ